MARKHILVTGSHRSGSTWVGKTIAVHSLCEYITEPFNVAISNRKNEFKIPYWYLNVDTYSPSEHKDLMKKVVDQHLQNNWVQLLKNPFQKVEGNSIPVSLKKRIRKARTPIKLFKDPFLLFSIPWMVQEFPIHPVVLIRHPAAFALSIKDKEWNFDFKNFLEQPEFFTGVLAEYEAEVQDYLQRKSPDIIENAALLWKILYAQVWQYQQQYPEWFYITHEELSLHPMKHFKKMFKYLELDWSPAVQQFIEKSTQAKTETEFARDAKANAEKWREQLTENEIERISHITQPIAQYFYKPF